MTKKLFFVLTLFAFVLTLGACSDDGSKEVIGAWKSIENGWASQKPTTLLIDEKSLSIDMASPDDVTFAKKDNKILILLKPGAHGKSFSTKEHPWFTVTIIDKDKAIFEKNEWGAFTYVRTTPEEIQRIADMPGL